jgi:hypothetical protein
LKIGCSNWRPVTFPAASFRASGVGNPIHGIGSLGELGVFPITPNLRVQKNGHSENWVTALAPSVTVAASFFVGILLWEANSLNPKFTRIECMPCHSELESSQKWLSSSLNYSIHTPTTFAAISL